jgi:hypothetical protein
VTVDATAVAAGADEPMRVILLPCDETLLDCTILLEDADFPWRHED